MPSFFAIALAGAVEHLRRAVGATVLGHRADERRRCGGSRRLPSALNTFSTLGWSTPAPGSSLNTRSPTASAVLPRSSRLSSAWTLPVGGEQPVLVAREQALRGAGVVGVERRADRAGQRSAARGVLQRGDLVARDALQPAELGDRHVERAEALVDQVGVAVVERDLLARKIGRALDHRLLPALIFARLVLGGLGVEALVEDRGALGERLLLHRVGEPALDVAQLLLVAGAIFDRERLPVDVHDVAALNVGVAFVLVDRQVDRRLARPVLGVDHRGVVGLLLLVLEYLAHRLARALERLAELLQLAAVGAERAGVGRSEVGVVRPRRADARLAIFGERRASAERAVADSCYGGARGRRRADRRCRPEHARLASSVPVAAMLAAEPSSEVTPVSIGLMPLAAPSDSVRLIS
jgi:hypothetical protein